MKNLKSFDDVIKHNEGKGFTSLTGKSIVLDFYADWCSPCKVASSAVEKLSEEMTHVDFFKVDIVDTPELAKVFNIKGIPSFIVITPESQVAIKVGWETEDTFKKFIIDSITNKEV